MMNKKQTSHRSIWKYALILPVLAMLLFFNSTLQTKAEPVNEMNTSQQTPQKAQDKPVAAKDEKVIFNHVEVMPEFPGGINALMKFLQDNLKYPEEAQKQGIQGRVALRFVVTPDGSVDDVQVMKSLDSLCDQEAVRVVNLMPKWIPGKQNGDPVYVYFSLPITFKLQADTPTPIKPIPDDIIIEIDGNVVSREEFQKLDPKTIESMSVWTSVKPNRLIIKTKKDN